MSNVNSQVSIVTVCKDDAKGLSKTLKSILAQDFQFWTCKIILGHSIDGSEMIAQEYSALDQRFSWKFESESGIFNAMNDGVFSTDSNYLIFLNSSDVFYDKYSLKVLFEAINESEYSIVVGGFLVRGESQPRFRLTKEVIGPSKFAFATKWGNHQSIIFRRSQTPKKYEDQYKISSDFMYILKCLINDKGLRIPTIVAEIEPGGLSDTKLVFGLLEKYRIRLQIFGFLQGCILNLVWTTGAILKRFVKKLIQLVT